MSLRDGTSPLFCCCCRRSFDMAGFQAHVPCRPPFEPEPSTRVFEALMSVSWDPTRWDETR